MAFPWAIAAASGSTALNVWGAREQRDMQRELSRQQMEFDERMSNTAMQRRVADIKAAGGNPALAFTTGSGASEPTFQGFKPENMLEGAAENIKNIPAGIAQVRNIQANTALQLAQARTATVEANNMETFGPLNAGTERSTKIAGLEKAEQDARKALSEANMTAKQEEFNERQLSAFTERAEQMAKMGKLNLEAMEDLAESLGLNAPKLVPFFKLLMNLLGGYKP